MKFYLKRLALYIIAVVVSTLLAPFLPLFAVMRCGQVNAKSYEPRLPYCLRWFDMPDNSLWGDHGWRTEHCPRFWGCYLGMALWLIRNKAGGIKHDLLAAKLTEPVTWQGERGIDSSPYKAGKLTCQSGEYWQWKYVSKPIGSRCLVLAFGWLLDAFIDDQEYQPKAKFLFQIQFSTRKP